MTETITNPIVMFFAGVAATLVIVLVLVLIWCHKRRRQAPKLSIGVLEVNAIEMQNEPTPESSSNNQVYISWNIV